MLRKFAVVSLRPTTWHCSCDAVSRMHCNTHKGRLMLCESIDTILLFDIGDRHTWDSATLVFLNRSTGTIERCLSRSRGAFRCATRGFEPATAICRTSDWLLCCTNFVVGYLVTSLRGGDARTLRFAARASCVGLCPYSSILIYKVDLDLIEGALSV